MDPRVSGRDGADLNWAEQILEEGPEEVESGMSIKEDGWVLELRTQGRSLDESYKSYINYWR